jgi:hypothetical protein
MALKTAEDDLGPIPVLPKNTEIAAAGSDDARSIFYRAVCEATLERARYDVVEAQFFVAWRGGDGIRGKELEVFQAARGIAMDRLRKALVRLAGLPAMDRHQLTGKKDMIGKIWLTSESVFRDAVARDEAYLATKPGARPRAKCDREVRT